MQDVIIVGAGPIGGYTAYLLSKQGLNVSIFEKNPIIGNDINCTGILSVDCIQKVKVSDAAILKPINSIKAVAPSGKFFNYKSSTPIAYVINRSEFDNEINRMAVSEGARIYLNARVKDFVITDDAFKIKVLIEGKEMEFRSRVGVVATGFELNSLINQFSRPQNFLYGVQTDVMMEDINDVEVYFGKKIAPGSFGWVVPINYGSAKIGLITKNKPIEFLNRFLQHPFINKRLQQYDKRIKCSPIPLKRIPKSYTDRLIVVGEAAGQVKTTTGGGIYYGLICSEIAARTILKAFECAEFSERTLKEYEAAWISIIDPEIKAGTVLRKLFQVLSDPQIDLLIDLAKRDGILPLIKKTDFDWHRDLVSYLLRNFFTKKLFGKL